MGVKKDRSLAKSLKKQNSALNASCCFDLFIFYLVLSSSDLHLSITVFAPFLSPYFDSGSYYYKWGNY